MVVAPQSRRRRSRRRAAVVAPQSWIKAKNKKRGIKSKKPAAVGVQFWINAKKKAGRRLRRCIVATQSRCSLAQSLADFVGFCGAVSVSRWTRE